MGQMTHRIPNDRKERLEFLRNLYQLRGEINDENVKIKNRKLEKQYLYIKKLQNNNKLPFIEIPEVLHTEKHGDLVFRIDHENGSIRILQRTYKWDSDENDIDDE